jgi:hypothetical protein
VLVTASEAMENQVMLDLLWHTCFRWKLWPDQVAADTTYGIIENIVPIEDAGIAMYTPLSDWDARTPYFGPSRFVYDPQTDAYRCPNGQFLLRVAQRLHGAVSEPPTDKFRAVLLTKLRRS